MPWESLRMALIQTTARPKNCCLRTVVLQLARNFRVFRHGACYRENLHELREEKRAGQLMLLQGLLSVLYRVGEMIIKTVSIEEFIYEGRLLFFYFLFVILITILNAGNL